MKTALATIAALAFSTACAAQDAETPAAPPAPPGCATDAAPYRDFDFWVGTWEVFNPANGNKAGENVISVRENGCLILEEWTSGGGGTGTSMNFYDPAQGAWRQVWRSAGVFIDYAGGLDADGAMAMEGAITYDVSGQTAPFRGKWTARDDGSVLQEFWQQDADGAWNVWFVGEYRLKADAEANE